MDKLKKISIASIIAVVVSFVFVLLNVTDINYSRGKILMVVGNFALGAIAMLVFYILILIGTVTNIVVVYKMKKN